MAAGGGAELTALHSATARSSGRAPARPVAAHGRSASGGPTARRPVRTCVGCRTRAPADDLLRVVAEAGVLVPDPRRRRPGRGAWLHPDPACLTRAERRSAFPRALRVPGPLDTTRLRCRLEPGPCGRAARHQDGGRETPGPDDEGSKVDPS
ncbi:MAG TPA: YlxR family protein [Pseudonocardia sp.]|nr:YlxR family protein [Pseudonocardia sp.]